MLTVDFAQFPVGQGERVLDMGCGGGRHAFSLYKRGADVVAFDMSYDDLVEVKNMFAAIHLAGEAPKKATATTVRGTAYELPFEDSSFDRIIAAEIMEHLPEDEKAMSELFRVLKPGGHIRIYKGSELRSKLERQGLTYQGQHHAHGLHSPYWWLKCAVGVKNDHHPLVKAYHQLLVWDMVKAPLATRLAEKVLQPLVGKSFIVYFRKPLETARAAA